MKDFLINNIDLVLAIVIALVGLGKALIEKKKKDINSNIYELIGDAEKLYPLGKTKFDWVFDHAYNKLPKWLKPFISKETIKRGIEFALAKIKAYSKLHSSNIISSGTVLIDPVPLPIVDPDEVVSEIK